MCVDERTGPKAQPTTFLGAVEAYRAEEIRTACMFESTA
jgi:hypothetical protein